MTALALLLVIVIPVLQRSSWKDRHPGQALQNDQGATKMNHSQVFYTGHTWRTS